MTFGEMGFPPAEALPHLEAPQPGAECVAKESLAVVHALDGHFEAGLRTLEEAS
jgi:hypothetical protein